MTETLMAPVSAPDPFDEGVPSKRKAAMIAGGLVAVLVLGAGGYKLLGGGSSDTNAVAPIKRGVPRVVAPVTRPAKATAVKPAAVLPPTSTASIGRDPFIALYTQPAPAAVTTTTSTGTATGTSATGAAAPTGTGTTASTATAPYALKLVSVTATSSSVRYAFAYAGTTKTVLAAQRFGKSGEVVVLATTYSSTRKVTGAVIQVGDDDPLTLSIGERVSVK